MQISIKYDGEIPEKIPGELKKGMLIINVNQKKEAINDVDWPLLGELMHSVTKD
jgi:hypothetical protein